MANPVLLAKDGHSGDDGCPSVYLEDGMLTIQGTARDLAGLQHPLPGEAACRISIDTVRRALDIYDQGGAR